MLRAPRGVLARLDPPETEATLVFCPNCGTQNPDTAQTCSKCNFNLKGAAAPKFKGTMLMQQAPQIPGAPGAAPGAPPPGVPAPSPATAPAMPSKLKGTMVGVAPPMPGSAPMGPGAGPGPMGPADPGFPPPGGGGGGGMGGGMGGYGAPQQPPMAPSPEHNTFGSPAGVNPLGGTMVAPDGMAGGFGAPPPGGYGAPPPGGGGYGAPQGGGYGAPDPNAGFGGPPPGGGGYGAPQGGGYGPPQGGGYGPPQGGGYGAPQPDYGQQMQQGFNQATDAISQGINQALGSGYGQPQQQGYGAPGGAMQPYPGGPMMQGGMQGMQAGPPGAHGPKGQVKNPLTSALLVAFVPFYGIIWLLGLCNEISAYRQTNGEPSAIKVLLLGMVTCGLYALYWMIAQLGPMIAEMQQRAGVPSENRGMLYWIPIYGVMCITEDLNKVWQSPN